MYTVPKSGNRRITHALFATACVMTVAFGSLMPRCACASASAAATPASEARAASEATAQKIDEARHAYPAAAIAPRVLIGGKSQVDKDAPTDEAAGGFTAHGVKLYPRNEQCFPTERRNLFSEVDKVIVGDDMTPRPMDYAVNRGDGSGKVVPDDAREAIMGQNTWMLWGEGNEAFWGWVQENGYGIADFLVLIDSRNHKKRFDDGGMINQPGMIENDKPIAGLGLYIDQADGNKVKLKAPDDDIDEHTKKPAEAEKMPKNEHHPYNTFFEVGDQALYDQTIKQLADDGVDPLVYGYPSGVVGLRLFPNPDFFGKSKAAEAARGYWQDKVTKDNGEKYYSRTDPSVHADPMLVRPFRVAMACAFCHVAPHPLAPPEHNDRPEWGNLSGTIGNQYWLPSKAFTVLKTEDSFIWQYVASQQAGTIDTSLVVTDHINNPNTIMSVFEVNARIARARENPPEDQSDIGLSLRSIEDAPLVTLDPRHTPRVLLDGADSVGVEGALLRVYLNIGAYSEQWRRLQNPIIGFKAQQPFDLATIRAKSIFWNTTERNRVGELERFLTYVSPSHANVTQPMKLVTTPEGRERIEQDNADIDAGRTVFLNSCAVCHSSKQPPGQQITFSDEWRTLTDNRPDTLVMPMNFSDWKAFTQSAPYAAYLKRLWDYLKTDQGQDLFNDNYLSTDIRVPVTLVGTNSQRAVGTNAMRGQIWDNFSSEAYKSLPAVGLVHFFNPFKKDGGVDEWGNNDAYAPPGGGPGYYRPASLVSLWATAPFLHNNALGIYNRDPSVHGRLTAFDDAIDKLLDKNKRTGAATVQRDVKAAHTLPDTDQKDECHKHPANQSVVCNALRGDLRQTFAQAGLTGQPGFSDVGFIYRTTQDSYIDFRRPFIRPLLDGVLGPLTTSVLTFYLWLALAVIALVLVFIARARLAAILLAVTAIALAALLRGTALDTIYPWLWSVPVVLLAAACLFLAVPDARTCARIFFGLVAIVFLATGMYAKLYVDGHIDDIKIGPIPRGTPVNLVMNINPDAPALDLFNAVSALTRGILRIRRDDLTQDPNHPFAALAAFQEEAGPALLKASKCPDFVLDRGHWFGEALTDQEKKQLKAFLETL